METPMKPFLVMLDLSDQVTYNTLVFALEDYTAKCEFDARNRMDDVEPAGSDEEKRVADLLNEANVARDLLGDIDRQLNES